LLLIGISAADIVFIKLSDAPALIISAYRMVFASLICFPSRIEDLEIGAGLKSDS
jgi:hypothetical protein